MESRPHRSALEMPREARSGSVGAPLACRTASIYGRWSRKGTPGCKEASVYYVNSLNPFVVVKSGVCQIMMYCSGMALRCFAREGESVALPEPKQCHERFSAPPNVGMAGACKRDP